MMNNRIFATCLAGMLGAGALLAPIAATARGGGGFTAGHAGFGASHGFVSRSFAQPRPAPIAAAIQGHGIRVGSAVVGPRSRFRRFFGYGLPLGGVGLYYGGYDDQTADTGAYQQPVYYPVADDVAPVPQDGNRVGFDRGVCRSQTVSVPSEEGGLRKVTITRC